VPSKEALEVFLSSLERRSYYDILRVPPNAAAEDIKTAFHDFSLLYHPDRFVDSPRDVADVATQIYKRGVEAYRCLARAPTRERYDRALADGRLRLGTSLVSLPPPPPAVRTLETIATDVRAKQFASKADLFISVGKLEEARVALITACQNEPDNAELAERLRFLYELLALEPP
jgi:curved DNA-binding protein CbpA